MSNQVITALFNISAATAQEQTGYERLLTLDMGAYHLFAIASGARAPHDGAEAAEMVIHAVTARRPQSTGDCVELLETLDQRMSEIGESAALVIYADGRRVLGASVGDSFAYLHDGSNITDLCRKRTTPLLGSGAAKPVAFEESCASGTLVLGSGRLAEYLSLPRISTILSSVTPDQSAAAILSGIHAPRIDAAVVVARWEPAE